jgi:stringent starvation protein B
MICLCLFATSLGEGMMSENQEHRSILEKINEKIHEYKHSSSSSSSDSDDDKPKKSKKKKKKKLFGRQNPLHHVLGGGKGISVIHGQFLLRNS